MFYLIEPYNPYSQNPAKKKHWMEIAEEEALFFKIMEANRNNTLPPTSPPQATPPISTVAGAGCMPVPRFFAPNLTQANISITSSTNRTGSAPYSMQFVNSSPTETLTFCNWLWTFGDGTTSTDVAPSHVYATGSFFYSVTASLKSNPSQTFTASGGVLTSSMPVVAASFTATPKTGPFPLTVQFTNTSQNADTFLWIFGSASYNTSSAVNPTFTYVNSGSFTVTLQASASNLYGAAPSVSSSAAGYISASLT